MRPNCDLPLPKRRASSVRRCLLDCQPLPRRRGLRDQLEFENTIVVFGLARRLVQLHWQREAAIDVAEIPLRPLSRATELSHCPTPLSYSRKFQNLTNPLPY